MQKRYRAADYKLRSQLLDDMEATTHLGCKHLIARMNGLDLMRHRRCRERQRVYDADAVYLARRLDIYRKYE